MKKISCLIFSMNEYDLIKNKIKILNPYVDEIVIIDSSTDEKQKNLMKKLKNKKIKVIWLPPIGLADFYYKIGIKECKYNWIFLLDADDFPCKNLLKDLKKLINDKYDAYKIYRGTYQFLFRLFKKKVAYPTGLIHWVLAVKTKNYKQLDNKKYWIKEKRKKEKIEERIKKYWKYRKIEEYQIGAKMLFFLNKKAYIWFEYPKYFNFVKTVTSFILKFGKVGFSILLCLWWLAYFFVGLKRTKKFFPVAFLHHLTFLLDVFKNFHLKYLAYVFQHSYGAINFLGLNSKKEIMKLSKKLNFSNKGLNNFLSLMKYKILKERMRI